MSTTGDAEGSPDAAALREAPVRAEHHDVRDGARPWLDPAFAASPRLDEASRHASYAHEHGGADQERLEFLGDAVLQLCVTAWLVERFPTAREGELSRLRQRIVSTPSLAAVGERHDIGAFVRLGAGEEASGGRTRPRVLAGTVEAVLGALFLDVGLDAANDVVHAWFGDAVESLAAEDDLGDGWKDPRSLLQEQIQRDLGLTPTYVVADRSGPAHAPRFVVDVCAGDQRLGRGEGASKREASRAAATHALRGEPPADLASGAT